MLLRTRTIALAGFAMAFLFIYACTSRPAVSKDIPSGTWSGEYDPGTGRSEQISVDLRWEDTNLRGVVHAGVRSIPIAKASFTADTGAISLEFDAEGNGGRTVHYIIDGKVSGNVMAGTWSHDEQHGEFRVTKQ